jgi:hypothetical protein
VGEDLVLNEMEPRAALVRHRGRVRAEIAGGVEAADVMPAALFGRDGVLVVHKRMQIRFYWLEGGRWQERVLYSFYSHSGQGGLALADIDGDGRSDIVCGNYWVQAPRSFDLHWRLFAINLWSEIERSAMMQLVVRGGRLWATQREMDQARLAVFEKPADPKEMWPERRITESLHQPRGLAVADFDGDRLPDVAVGEAGGAARVLLFSRGQSRVLHQGDPVLGLHAAAPYLYVITGRSVLRLSLEP